MDDLISRQAAIRWVKTECSPYGKPTLEFESGKKVIEHLEQMPSAQPEREILAWLLAYHQKSFELHGRYMAHEVIGWLVHDFASDFMGEES